MLFYVCDDCVTPPETDKYNPCPDRFSWKLKNNSEIFRHQSNKNKNAPKDISNSVFDHGSFAIFNHLSYKNKFIKCNSIVHLDPRLIKYFILQSKHTKQNLVCQEGTYIFFNSHEYEINRSSFYVINGFIIP